VQAGSLVVQVAGSSQTVRRGETVRYVASVQHAIANNGKTAAKAILVVEYSPGT
jgi:quercetin dioxygenase-like cupin family protein